MEEIELTPTSYIVLGLLRHAGESTSYELKGLMANSVGYFWSLPHAALYAEPKRLAGAGYVSERQERTGRRRRHYAITERGRDALSAWLGEPTHEHAELREPATLKLFFGGDPLALAEAQLESLRGALEQFEAMRATDPGGELRGPWLALDMGIGHVRASIRFWEGFVDG